VNGDDVEALTLVGKMAIEFRLNFRKDVFIDILCYRKYGHNEGDEPRFTQPLLYKHIAAHPNPMKLYSQRLIEEGTFTKAEIDKLEKSYKDKLEEELAIARKTEKAKVTSFLQGPWKGVQM